MGSAGRIRRHIVYGCWSSALAGKSSAALDQEEQNQKYAEFQDLIIEDAPAIFLYSPSYLYPVNKKVRGIEIKRLAQPSYRFSQIENWFINIDRVWK